METVLTTFYTVYFSGSQPMVQTPPKSHHINLIKGDESRKKTKFDTQICFIFEDFSLVFDFYKVAQNG